MHHNVRQVAKNRFFDVEQFFDFAKANKVAHHVVGDEDHLIVSTYHVDGLVDAFKEALGDACDFSRP